MKISEVFLIRIFGFIIVLLLNSSAFAEQSSSGSINIKFPVRVSLFVGDQYSDNKLGTAYSQTVNHIAYGADINIPIKMIYFTVGLTGWYLPPDFLLVGPYVGYAGDYRDIFLGIAGANYSNTQGDPNVQTTKLSASLGCTILGVRQYFGSGFNFGAGLTGFTCNSKSYDQTITTGLNGSPVKTEIKEEAGASGALLYLMFFWNDYGRAMK